MAGNKNLNKAARAKNDEFYTQLTDIENELRHYKDHFKNKIIFCNCDDPEESNFFRYFALNFEHLGIKKLIATHFDAEEPTYKLEIVRELDINSDGKIDFQDIQRIPLKQNGDFRSPECVEILKSCDIVVTNPPFSLFREYVAQLMEYEKKFVIVGNQNAITYKEIFKLIKENKIWLGNGFTAGNAFFEVPDNFENTQIFEVNGKRLAKFRNCHWFTNLDHAKRHEDLLLYKLYSPEEYPNYDNYHAIEVSKVKDIPINYNGVMGVPITFMDKYNPEQFEIVGATESEGKGFSNGLWIEESKVAQPLINQKRVYKRIFIKHK